MRSHSARLAIYRQKAGAVLVGLQIAVTVAILSNAVALIVDRLFWSARQTGIDEANIFFVSAISVDKPASLATLTSSDLAALRSLPDVSDAYAANTYPLEGSGFSMDVRLKEEQKSASAHISYYFGDEHALDTLGVRLIAGRNFIASEVHDRGGDNQPTATGLIITQALAQRLFPHSDALGQSIYVDSKDPVPIIGIMGRLQGPFIAATGYNSTFSENTALAPFRPLSTAMIYSVRSSPGSLYRTMQSAQNALAAINGIRIITADSMLQVRSKAYRGNRGLTLLLASVALILVAVTGFGMVGLTSYWVAQRRRQIGIRRALGATRLAILRQFQRENFLISTTGVLTGSLLAIALNLWLVDRFEMIRIGSAYVISGDIAMLLLGQIAVFWPALRASAIPPAIAVRGNTRA